MTPRSLATNNSTEVRLIGSFFLVAGLIGFFMFFDRLFPFSDFLNLLNLLPAGLFALTTYSGYLLVAKGNATGLEIGRAIVALQIIGFQGAGFAYVFITGPYAVIRFGSSNAGFNLGLRLAFEISIYEDVGGFLVQVNIIALVAFIYLTRAYNRATSEEGNEGNDVLDSGEIK